MKKITILWSILFCSLGTMFAQTPAELAEIQANDAMQNQPIDIQELLDRKEAIGTTVLPMSHYFSAEEISALRAYDSNQNRNVLADIIPTAGATESFAVAAGDTFFDPGGPGGSSTGGTPGNYPNCGCVTLTTLTGVQDINFDFFSVFSTFDWLRIYDGADTTGTVLYDNSDTGAQSGDITTADMAASTGTMFSSTTGNLTFEFNATAVVDYGGWEVSILSAAGPGDFYVKDGFPGDAFGTMPQAGPYNINPIANFADQLFSDDFAADGLLYSIDFGSGNLVTVDITTGDRTVIGPTGMTASPTGISYNFFDGTMYAIDTDITETTLYTVDLSTGAATVVGTTGIPGGIWLEIDNNGVGYIADIVNDEFHSIDLATATATLVGPIGQDLNFAQEATYDHDNDILYAGLYSAVTEISTIDVTTGTPTILGSGSYEAVMLSLEGGELSNNVCEGAEDINCGDTVTGDTSDNTDNGGANASPDEWYQYTGSGFEEIVTVSLCDGGTGYDSFLTVYDACGGNVVADNDDFCGLQSELTFTSDGTTTYYIAVEGFGTNAGAYSLALSCIVPLDDCETAGSISCGETVLGSTANGATPDPTAPDCGGGNDAPGVWYVIDDTSGLVTDYTVSLCDGGTSYDSKLVVYSGDCGALVCVAENDDSCGLQSEVSFQGDGSSTYYILVNGFASGSSGDFSLNLECAPVPPPNDMIVNSIDVDEIGFPYTDPAVAMPAATTEAGGTPANCDNAGVLGVWYNFVPTMGGTATASVTSPAGFTSVTFYTAPDENAVETDLTLVDWFDNQCVPGVDASIPVTAGQAYYVYVANHEGITDIVIDGDFFLGIGDETIQGFSYYPNPATNELNLQSGNGTIESAIIYNILGQEVVNQNVDATNAVLDVANLSVGTYMLKVVVNGETGIYKVVKQ
ncbi:T9SS type A sorting domain-containing protein [Marinirhabdus gelatinilytica]|uniref:Putative secreted protein (Por secretion system target) n=1 Tax=Marinirhabdus gelatinilytica TaxID=1703343 RepID=A0A370QER7_9FLAO|nr:T9SS type A sorting domain-containing protein [Marinirhabdus gelatinilytica]RDK86867.1 putative secreted protein (Por secretion system target) [Marinirhabdus gelatinilytica]